MKITVNGIGQKWEKTIADDSTEQFDVPNGSYKVFAYFGVCSNIVNVSIPPNTVNLTAMVVPKQNAIGIEQVVLI